MNLAAVLLFAALMAIDGLSAHNVVHSPGSPSGPGQERSSTSGLGAGHPKDDGLTPTKTDSRHEQTRQHSQQTSNERSAPQNQKRGYIRAIDNVDEDRNRQDTQTTFDKDSPRSPAIGRRVFLHNGPGSKSPTNDEAINALNRNQRTEDDQKRGYIRAIDNVHEDRNRQDTQTTFDKDSPRSPGVGRRVFLHNGLGSTSPTDDEAKDALNRNQRTEDETAHQGGPATRPRYQSGFNEGGEDQQPGSQTAYQAQDQKDRGNGDQDFLGEEGSGQNRRIESVVPVVPIVSQRRYTSIVNNPSQSTSETIDNNQNYANGNVERRNDERNDERYSGYIRNFGADPGRPTNGVWNNAQNNEHVIGVIADQGTKYQYGIQQQQAYIDEYGNHNPRTFTQFTGSEYQSPEPSYVVSEVLNQGLITDQGTGVYVNKIVPPGTGYLREVNDFSELNHGIHTAQLVTGTGIQDTNVRNYVNGIVALEADNKEYVPVTGYQDESNGVFNKGLNDAQLVIAPERQGINSGVYVNEVVAREAEYRGPNEGFSRVPNQGLIGAHFISASDDQAANSRFVTLKNVYQNTVPLLNQGLRNHFVTGIENQGDHSGKYINRIFTQGTDNVKYVSETDSNKFIIGVPNQEQYKPYFATGNPGTNSEKYNGNVNSGSRYGNGDLRDIVNRDLKKPQINESGNQVTNSRQYVNRIEGTDNINYVSGTGYNHQPNKYLNGLLNQAHSPVDYLSGTANQETVPNNYVNGILTEGLNTDQYGNENQDSNSKYTSEIFTQPRNLIKPAAMPSSYGAAPSNYRTTPNNRKTVYGTPNNGIRFYEAETGSYMANPSSAVIVEESRFSEPAPAYVIPMETENQAYRPGYYRHGGLDTGPGYIFGTDETAPTTIFGKNPRVFNRVIPIVTGGKTPEENGAKDITRVLIDRTLASNTDYPFNNNNDRKSASETVIDKDLFSKHNTRKMYANNGRFIKDGTANIANNDLTSEKSHATKHLGTNNDSNIEIVNKATDNKTLLPKNTDGHGRDIRKIHESVTKTTKAIGNDRSVMDDNKPNATDKDDDGKGKRTKNIKQGKDDQPDATDKGDDEKDKRTNNIKNNSRKDDQSDATDKNDDGKDKRSKNIKQDSGKDDQPDATDKSDDAKDKRTKNIKQGSGEDDQPDATDENDDGKDKRTKNIKKTKVTKKQTITESPQKEGSSNVNKIAAVDKMLLSENDNSDETVEDNYDETSNEDRDDDNDDKDDSDKNNDYDDSGNHDNDDTSEESDEDDTQSNDSDSNSIGSENNGNSKEGKSKEVIKKPGQEENDDNKKVFSQNDEDASIEDGDASDKSDKEVGSGNDDSNKNEKSSKIDNIDGKEQKEVQTNSEDSENHGTTTKRISKVELKKTGQNGNNNGKKDESQNDIESSNEDNSGDDENNSDTSDMSVKVDTFEGNFNNNKTGENKNSDDKIDEFENIDGTNNKKYEDDDDDNVTDEPNKDSKFRKKYHTNDKRNSKADKKSDDQTDKGGKSKATTKRSETESTERNRNSKDDYSDILDKISRRTQNDREEISYRKKDKKEVDNESDKSTDLNKKSVFRNGNNGSKKYKTLPEIDKVFRQKNDRDDLASNDEHENNKDNKSIAKSEEKVIDNTDNNGSQIKKPIAKKLVQNKLDNGCGHENCNDDSSKNNEPNNIEANQNTNKDIPPESPSKHTDTKDEDGSNDINANTSQHKTSTNTYKAAGDKDGHDNQADKDTIKNKTTDVSEPIDTTSDLEKEKVSKNSKTAFTQTSDAKTKSKTRKSRKRCKPSGVSRSRKLTGTDGGNGKDSQGVSNDGKSSGKCRQNCGGASGTSSTNIKQNETSDTQSTDNTKTNGSGKGKEEGSGSGSEEKSYTKEDDKTTFKKQSNANENTEKQEDSKDAEESQDSKGKIEEGNKSSSNDNTEEADGSNRKSSDEDKTTQASPAKESKSEDSNENTENSKSSS